MSEELTSLYMEKATMVGCEVVALKDLKEAAEYIKGKAEGPLLVPDSTLCTKFGMKSLLQDAGATLHEGSFREAGHLPAGGVTFSNFAIGESGTVVLDSTPEDVRLATTIPEKYFVVVDPATIVADGLGAVEAMTALHTGHDPRYVAYISGPSRTADIERVLTIGAHGPREVYVLLVEGISSDFMEN